MAHIVVSGSIEAGFEFYGPFEDGTAAHNWAEAHEEDRVDFDVIELRSPRDNELDR